MKTVVFGTLSSFLSAHQGEEKEGCFCLLMTLNAFILIMLKEHYQEAIASMSYLQQQTCPIYYWSIVLFTILEFEAKRAELLRTF